MNPLIQQENASVTFDTLPVLKYSENNFMQLLQNLISNSIKFRGEESPIVHIGVKKQKAEWVFAVRDNGIGIDDKYQEKIFLIFQQLHPRDKYSGTGIGLSICKKIVEMHGGRIWVESALGKGSTFYFTVPIIMTKEV
jgi:light-regulated signal transduction histidine kinase (bacteriophytochrome)